MYESFCRLGFFFLYNRENWLLVQNQKEKHDITHSLVFQDFVVVDFATFHCRMSKNDEFFVCIFFKNIYYNNTKRLIQSQKWPNTDCFLRTHSLAHNLLATFLACDLLKFTLLFCFHVIPQIRKISVHSQNKTTAPNQVYTTYIFEFQRWSMVALFVILSRQMSAVHLWRCWGKKTPTKSGESHEFSQNTDMRYYAHWMLSHI